ncbi:MAG: AAA family ATPase [Deltaproteobacteria bacterium]|nr:AAA family ATPase [Deltaproteobacteria bacterium]
MANDMEILRRAYDRENDSRNRGRLWAAYHVGATRADINRLLAEELIAQTHQSCRIGRYDYSPALYRLAEKGRSLVFATTMEREFERVPAADILEAMSLIVGFDDLKQAISQAIETRRRINFLLEGPPACAKSLILEGVRSAVPSAYIAFGSRTSASGLSDALFEHQPTILLLDEIDKMHNDCYSVLLGLMESGEILETKSRRTRGVKLETMVIGACNSTAKMPQEFLSRFALHVFFPSYSRDEFIDVCRGFLARAENCPEDIACTIGSTVFDYGLGDVRKARGVWQLMTSPTEEEVYRVARLMKKYSRDNHNHNKKQKAEAKRLL